MCALLISVITLSGAANRSFHTTLEQWNPIGFTQSQAGAQTTNRLTAGSAILPTVATAAPSGVLRGGSTNEITFTTAKGVGKTILLYMEYSGDTPTLSGLDGTPKSGTVVTYTLTSQTVTIRGDVTYLDCAGEKLTALDVSQNTALTKLYCFNNELTALIVSKNTALTVLDCKGNQLKALDIPKGTALTMLVCHTNQLTALDVSKNTALTKLYCEDNQLTALDLSKNTALTKLDCSGNKIKGKEMTRLVNSLPDRTGKNTGTFTVVQEPDLEGNICLKSDVAIAKSKNWNTLKYNYDTEEYVAYEGAELIMSFTTAKAVGEEITFYMEYSGDAPTLSGATGTPKSGGYVTYTLTSQTVTIRGDVTHLNCSKNQLTALDVSKNTELTVLYCDNNQLTALDVSQNTELKGFWCYNNQLTALDVSKNTALQTLNCYNNQLKALDVSKNTVLRGLYCEENQLTTLDVSKNTILIELYCYGNQIKGEKMTRLVNSLPDRSGREAGTFTVVQEPDLEGNICLKSDVAIAKGKNWVTQEYDSDYNEYFAYEGAKLIISFTTAKAVGKTVELLMLYTGAAPTLSGATGTPISGKWITYTLTSQTVTIRGDVTFLVCFNNQLTTLDVSQNTALTWLACSYNQLKALDVSQNTVLENLYCSDNQLTTLDVSQNTALTDLNCSGNQIKGGKMTRLVNSLPDRIGKKAGTFTVVREPGLEGNICLKSDVAIAKGKNWNTQKYNSDTEEYVAYEGEEPSPYIMSFTTAKAAGEQISLYMKYSGAAPILSGATGTPESGKWITYKLTSQPVTIRGDVTYLDCSKNQLTTLDVSKNTTLEKLYCSENQLTTLDASQNSALTTLTCKYNQLTALDVSKNPALTTLDCFDNQLTTLDVSKNTALTWLDCSHNQLTALDITQNIALTELYCTNNQLTALDLSQNTALAELYCRSNQLTTLDVSKNTALTELDCSANPLTALDVSKNTALTTLECTDNQLTTVDVSKNTALTTLDCTDNQLTTLDVSKNTALTTLECYNNQLTALDVSQNTALTTLYCFNNQLTALDVSKNTALAELDCSHNQLTTLDVSQNTSLAWFSCSGNQIKGAEMTRLVNSLPDLTGKEAGQIVVVQSGAESNRCLKSDVAIAKGKNWIIEKYNSDTEESVPYEGEEPIPYAVTLTKEGEGTITATGAADLNAVPEGTELTIEATPAAGYELKALTANNTDILATKKFTVRANTEVKATFAKTFAVTLTKEGEGTLKATGAADLNAVPEGTELTIEATPADGYELKALTANGTDILAAKKFVVTAATEVKAIFAKKTAADRVESSSVRLYPNPASTYVNVKGAKAEALVRLYDANGSLRYEARTDADGALQIDLSAYAEGTYLLRVGNDAQRLLIQR